MGLASLLKIRERFHLGRAGGVTAGEKTTSPNPEVVFIGAEGDVFEVY